MKIDILTLFPDMFRPILNDSIIGKAQENSILTINTINIRNFSADKHNKVDDYPYGGGSGMLLSCQPLFDALESLTHNVKKPRIIYMTPKGNTFNQKMANDFSLEDNLIIICGHYEGIDQRVIDYWVTDEVSIGDFVLTGGEIPAMLVVDSVARLIPGVLNKNDSYQNDTFYNGLLEHPQYTRPSNFKGLEVPDILLSGNHKLISEWKLMKSIKETLTRRPDLIDSIYNSPNLDYNEKKKIKDIIHGMLIKE